MTGYRVYRSNGAFVGLTLSQMQDSRVFAFRGHGNQQVIRTGPPCCSSCNNRYALTMQMVQALPNNALGDLRLFVASACATGEGGINGNNLINAVHGRGAHITIGFQENIYTVSGCAWMEAFIPALRGRTVHSAMDVADDVLESYRRSWLLWQRPRGDIRTQNRLIRSRYANNSTNVRISP